MNTRAWIVSVCFLSLLGSGHAQQWVVPLDQEITREVEWYSVGDSGFHSSVKPYTVSRAGYNTIRQAENDRYKRKTFDKWFWRKLHNEHLVRIDTESFVIEASAIIHLEVGRDQEDPETVNYIQNTRGFDLRGNLGSKLFFQSAFFENQARVPGFVDSLIRESQVAPGAGRVKIQNDTFDYSQATGMLAYQPTDWLQLQAGHGKHFIGEGYRSFFLSDNSFNYPYLRSSVQWQKHRIQYDNIWASLQYLERVPRVSTPEGPFQRKAATFHHLSYQATDWLNLGLFEAVMWQRWDTSGTRAYNPAIANPLLFVSTAALGLEDEHNALIGLDATVTPHRKVKVYGQVLLDSDDEMAWQAGVKSYGLIPGLFVRLERNQADRGMFDHRLPLQNYGHHGQPLGHQLGSGFEENLVELRYRYRGFFVQLQAVSATYGAESDSIASGRNIFRATDESLFAMEPPEVQLTNIDLRLGYVVNTATNLQWYVGVRSREEGDGPGGRTTYVYGALRSSLTNLYSDF